MSQLLNRFQLAKELEIIINEAQDYLILISPYFKLNAPLKSALEKHSQRKDFFLIIVYGKNEEDRRKSLCDEDLLFFKSFQDVEIRYHKRLHAKIYLNEEKCLITSLNLHDYSLKENIEVGILTKSKPLDVLKGLINSVSKNLVKESLDAQAAEFANYIVEKSTVEFKKAVKREKHLFGLFTTTKESSIVIENSRTGFCIRTKLIIPLNPKHPYSMPAYQSWQVYKRVDYREKYCHVCGKEHPTSMAKPVCLDCYKNSKQ